MQSNQTINVAIEGCLHGQLDSVYNHLEQMQKNTGVKIDVLLICGDFQATRDEHDLDDMHCPPKYKDMRSFHSYFDGHKEAPYLTIFIGGNHESVNYLRKLYFGGWVAQNIYYLGQAGSIYLTKGAHRLRITGASGIYNHQSFQHHLSLEPTPLKGRNRITSYHTKQIDMFRLELLGRIGMMQQQQPQNYGQHNPFHIFLSHDWPKDIALYGNKQELLKYKPFLKEEIQNGMLGSPPLNRLMSILQPCYWFCAHMHVKYPALFPHPNGTYTHFLCLDKCLGNRHCLQVLNLPMEHFQPTVKREDNGLRIEADMDWLAVIKLTQKLHSQKELLYKYKYKNLALHNIDKMNNYIQAYPKCIPTIPPLDIPHLTSPYQEHKQTMELLSQLGMDVSLYEGVVLDEGEHNDEIQLSL